MTNFANLNIIQTFIDHLKVGVVIEVAAERTGITSIAGENILLEVVNDKLLESKLLTQADKLRILEYTNRAKILTLLATDEDPVIRASVAANIWTPCNVHSELVKDPSTLVRIAIAGNPGLSSTNIRLVNDPNNSKISRALIGNPNTPYELEKSLSNRYPITQGSLREFIGNPIGFGCHTHANPNAYLLEKNNIITDKNEYKERIRKSCDSKTRAEELYELAKDEEWVIRLGVAENDSATEELLRILASDPETEVREAVARHANLLNDLRSNLSLDTEIFVRKSVASSPLTSAHDWSHLVSDEHPEVRKALAKNQAALALFAKLLSKDPDDSVRSCVATHLKSQPEILLDLANDPEIKVVKSVAKNPFTPMELLRQIDQKIGLIISESEKCVILKSIVAHSKLGEFESITAKVKPRCFFNMISEYFLNSANTKPIEHLLHCFDIPPIIFRMMAESPDKKIRLEAAKHSLNLPIILSRLAEDPEPEIREAVGRHKRTPPDILCLLAHDKITSIRKIVADNPHTPAHIRESLQI